MRVAYETMLAEFERVLKKYGFTADRAHDAAEIFAQNSLAGVFSHGLNRFPVAVDYLKKGEIDPAAEAECVASFGSMERWDGHRGFGPLNAKRAMDRAVELAKQNGIGLVALGNNNHWMRGGTYGWQAADAGCIGICWSNTCPNMPAWGARDNHIGNNPLILAVPRSNGEHVMVDCALSQFSYGKLETTRLAGKQLPVVGGYDEEGNLTTDPAAIEKTRRMIPIGYWKGSGLSILLDMIATILTNANSVAKIGTFGDEIGLSSIMSWVMAFTGLPDLIANGILSLTGNKYVILILMNIILLIVGTFMDPTPAVLIFTPIFLPICKTFGMHTVQFGIMVSMNLCIGTITPPVGSILFTGCKVGHVKIEQVIKELLPYFFAILVALLLATYIPAISMTLPTLAGLIK